MTQSSADGTWSSTIVNIWFVYCNGRGGLVIMLLLLVFASRSRGYFCCFQESHSPTFPTCGSSTTLTSRHFWKHFQQRPLDAVFRPKSVALIGASEKEGSVGKTIRWNLLSSPFGGTIYPVNNNPGKLNGNVFGIRSYQRMQDLPKQGIDLAMPPLLLLLPPPTWFRTAVINY